jgi:hypothetical protein
MAKHVHTATGPNGEQFKRTSASKRYTHVIIARHCPAKDETSAKRSMPWNAKTFEDHVKHAAHGYEPAGWMVGKPVLPGDEKEFPEAKDMAEAFRAKGKKSSTEWLAQHVHTDGKAFAQAVYDTTVSTIKTRDAEGYYDVFHALAWSSRYDLAQKAAGPYSDHWGDIRIIEVNA